MSQRPIKFRAWDKENKKLWYIADEDFGWLGNNKVREDMKIMQFTGLYDKNVKEIFEDDLCRVSISRSCPHGIVRIGWWEQGSAFVAVNPQRIESVTHNFVRDEVLKWEVLGNIYENPELLNP